MTYLTTTEAAWYVGVNARSFARWAKLRGIEPELVGGKGRKTWWSSASLGVSLDKTDSSVGL